MPTLIIVQVGLGRAIHDLETTSSNDPLSRVEANKAAGISLRSFTEANASTYSGPNYVGAYPTQRSSSVIQIEPCPGSTGEIPARSLPFRSESTRRQDHSQLAPLKTHRSGVSDSATAQSFRDDEDTGSFTPAPQRRSRKRSTRSRTDSNASGPYPPRSPTPAFGYELPDKSLSKRTLYETGLDGYVVPCVVRSPAPYSPLHSAPSGIVPLTSPGPETPELARPHPMGRGQSYRVEEVRGDGRWWGSRGHERSNSFPLSLVPSRASSDDSKGPYTPI